MKIELNTHNLTTLIDGINNAIIAYRDIYSAKFFCCDCPEKWEQIGEEKIKERLNELNYIYDQLLTLENEN